MTTTTTPVLPAAPAAVDIAAILDRAADYLTCYGWTPAGLYENHRNCPLKCRVHRTGGYPASILGAIRCAVFGAPRWYLDTTTPAERHAYTEAVEWFNTYLLAHGPARMHASVFSWETTPDRNRIHVIAALRHAAAIAHRHHTQRRAA